LLVAGWSLVAVFGVLVLVISKEATGWVHLTVGLLMAVWSALRPGVAASVVSLVLGLLFLLIEGGYVIAGLSNREATGILISDLEGLVAALLVVLGAGLSLVRRRSASPATAPVDGP
jgi:uncharacterized membrane protein